MGGGSGGWGGVEVLPRSLGAGEARGTQSERSACPRREKRKGSFMPVEITGAWVRAEKGIVGRIVWGWFAPGLKPRPPKARRRGDAGLPTDEVAKEKSKPAPLETTRMRHPT